MGGLLLAGAGVGVYFLSRPRNTQTLVVPVAPKPLPKKKVVAPTVKRVWRPATFPLQKGMQGPQIGELQVALKAIGKLGINFQSDGKFGADTETVLSHLGFPVIIDQNTFAAIKAKAAQGDAPANETKYQKLQRLGYKAKSEIEPAIALNETLTSNLVSDSTVKSLLKADNNTLTNIQRAFSALTGKKLVNELLSLNLARVRFNEQITRLQALSGLQGLDGKAEIMENGPTVYARVNTIVKIKGGAEHPVKAGSILGVLVAQRNGTAWFKEPKGNILKVPYGDLIWRKQ